MILHLPSLLTDYMAVRVRNDCFINSNLRSLYFYFYFVIFFMSIFFLFSIFFFICLQMPVNRYQFSGFGYFFFDLRASKLPAQQVMDINYTNLYLMFHAPDFYSQTTIGYQTFSTNSVTILSTSFCASVCRVFTILTPLLC